MADKTDTPPVPEMVERVARKLFSDGAGLFLLDSPTEPRWEDASPLRQMFFRNVAANLIRELREPTEAMKKAGGKASLADGAHDCEVPMSDVWGAMIAAALGE